MTISSFAIPAGKVLSSGATGLKAVKLYGTEIAKDFTIGYGSSKITGYASDNLHLNGVESLSLNLMLNMGLYKATSFAGSKLQNLSPKYQMRQRVLANIEESRLARESSNYSEFEGRFTHYNNLKDGLLEDEAWNKFQKYCNKNGKYLKTLSDDEYIKLQKCKIEEFKDEIIGNEKKLALLNKKTDKLLKLSDIRLKEAVASGYSARDYYRIVNMDKSEARAILSEKALGKSNLPKEWYNEFYKEVLWSSVFVTL